MSWDSVAAGFITAVSLYCTALTTIWFQALFYSKSEHVWFERVQVTLRLEQRCAGTSHARYCNSM